MKRLATLMALATAGFLAGCNGDGLEFNGSQQIEQFEVRNKPVARYEMPSVVIDQATDEARMDADTLIPLGLGDFQEHPSPGHDQWAMWYIAQCTDNPTCTTPAPVIDMLYSTRTGLQMTHGAGWPHPDVTPTTTPENFIAAWTCSFQNQWFLRDVDGESLNDPVNVDGTDLESMAISIHDISAGSNFTTQTTGAHQETTDQSPPGTGQNGIQRVEVPVNNLIQFMWDGLSSPEGLIAGSWREDRGENTHIESMFGDMTQVPVPDYFGGAGPIDTGGGIYLGRFTTQWEQSTEGANSVINKDDGIRYSYFLAAVTNQLIGYGVGLNKGAFALPGEEDPHEDIMTEALLFDISAFVAAAKEFYFVGEDMLTMQDVVNGELGDPDPDSTLPGSHRRN